MVIVMPSDTLKLYGITSRGTPSFNVCLGALNLDPGGDITKWQQKNLGKKGGVKPSNSRRGTRVGRARRLRRDRSDPGD